LRGAQRHGPARSPTALGQASTVTPEEPHPIGTHAGGRRAMNSSTETPQKSLRSNPPRPCLRPSQAKPPCSSPYTSPLGGWSRCQVPQGIPCTSTRRWTRACPAGCGCEVGSRHPALHRSVLPLGGVRGADRGRVPRHPVHRSLPARHLRVQRRGAALDLAGRLLRVRGARHRPVPAVHPRRHPGLPGSPGHRVPPNGSPVVWCWSSGCWRSRTTSSPGSSWAAAPGSRGDPTTGSGAGAVAASSVSSSWWRALSSR